MSTFRDTVSWIVALLGAVAIYQAFGTVWLAAWTVGVTAFIHSRNWSGPFPGDDDALDELSHVPPLHYVSQDPEDRGDDWDRDGLPAGHSHRFDRLGVCVHPGCGLSRDDAQRSSRTFRAA